MSYVVYNRGWVLDINELSWKEKRKRKLNYILYWSDWMKIRKNWVDLLFNIKEKCIDMIFVKYIKDCIIIFIICFYVCSIFKELFIYF